MSNPKTAHVLTPDRIADLRRIATGVTRVAGAPWEPSRVRIEWFVREGYIVLGPAPEPRPHADPRHRVRRAMTLTDKAWMAIREDDARNAAAWDAARREMMP